ncbi:hypothetical protein [Lapillicoccus sp.]|uniref:hypothetical protein n=1 Tax=Lapillicoccus sp. TaxID=1909287 RepID=UPI0025E6FE23|nr:hypothetical protein [Lapillicoccus sp.]
MTYLYATLLTLRAGLRDRAATTHARTRTRTRDEGASTIEIVFWAVGLLALAGIVYAAIAAYINSKVSSIK